MATIYHQVLIQASREAVYEAVTTQHGLSKWWIQDCTVKAEKGFINEFRMAGHGTNLMEVLALQPPTFVEWRCLNKNDPWTDTHLTFEITTKGDFTCLDFKHMGYPNPDHIYATCNFHWARHLAILKIYCETGISTLNQTEEEQQVKAVLEGKV
ncbi:SRPBCC family protein [Pontibacter oryzae]|uniref:SRPBCC domain-containing protein n=1 Tax=Pontibacter oryzae TaxID=2304593 RepID=A0A399SHA4_9BACT|nr:SRPBCC domain-containing protein [Pontibacter oryzae]RIJ42374.1 SRPBCC domain-containing protein [Pontibacter oryzae]